MKLSPLVAVALLIGCATGAAVSQLSVPPARAQPTLVRWEYTCRDNLDSFKGGLQAGLDAFTAQRWELITANQSITNRGDDRWSMCFKRAVY